MPFPRPPPRPDASPNMFPFPGNLAPCALRSPPGATAPRRPRPAPDSGAALILALAAVVTAAGLLLLLQARALNRSAQTNAMLEAEHLRIAASETARAALRILAADADLDVDHPGEDWAQILECDWTGDIHAWAQIDDAGAHVNLNNLAADKQPARDFKTIVRNAFTCCGNFESDAPVEALADYEDADTEGTYEAAFYRHAEAPLAPPNRPLWAPAELLDVYGFSAALFAPPKVEARRTRDELFGGDFRLATTLVPGACEEPVPVNVNTATREALLAVAGVEHAEIVRSAMALRSLRPFTSLAMLGATRPELAEALDGALDVKSAYFRVRASAERNGRRRTVVAWARRDTDGIVHLLQWLEGES